MNHDHAGWIHLMLLAQSAKSPLHERFGRATARDSRGCNDASGENAG